MNAAGPSRLPMMARNLARSIARTRPSSIEPIPSIRRKCLSTSSPKSAPNATRPANTTSSSPLNFSGTSASAGAGAGAGTGAGAVRAQPDLAYARRAMEASRDRMYAERKKKNSSALLYWTGGGLLALGAAYASVPLYRAFCTDSGITGKPVSDPARFAPDRLYADPETADRKRINVRFEATASDVLPWDFSPVTRNVKVLPGETALAFYTATNKGDKDLIGIATYNITPERVAPYFAKVECFCFEEQKIRAGEEVDLPVFFFIDRDILDDPAVGRVEDVVLNYTFFRAKRNDRGHLVPDAPEDVVQKSQGFEGYELAKPQTATA